jgi:hypothetical protein
MRAKPALALVAGFFCACAPLPKAAEANSLPPPPLAWRSEAYVWQREASPELTRALAEAREALHALYPLAAEINWDAARRPTLTRVPLDHAALAAHGKIGGLVLRIGPWSGPFAADDETARLIARAAADILAAARHAGWHPPELQVDFDCAERSLGGYLRWLRALRAVTGEDTRLVFTALPAWLRHREAFAALAAAADGYVLQVHSLEKPAGGPDAPYSLCNYDDALRWARAAAEAAPGRPFRVALPTYGYRLAFDAEGRFFALSAEGPAPRRPAGTITRVVRSDPAEMLRIERALAAEPPPGCEGVIWFRLPVEGDRLNWAMPTFLRVLAGEVPRARIEVAARWSAPGLAEIVVENSGDTSEPPPGRVRIAWPATARLLAADGLGGHEPERRRAEASLVLKSGPETREVLLGPGKTRAIGWLRFADETTLEVTREDETPGAAP